MADCTPQALAAAASCLRCLPKRRPVRTYLLCQWANLPPTPTGCTDPDALAFIDRAGIIDETQKAAVCQLVLDLKNTGSPSFWNRDIIIYPMIGPLAPNPYQHHRVNLKTALSSPGLYDFVQYLGVTPTYDAGGMKGNGVNAFVNTMFIPSVDGAAMQNEMRVMYYLDSEGTTTDRFYFGTANAGRLFSRLVFATPPFSFSVNDTTSSAPFADFTTPLGARFIQRSSTIDAANPKMATFYGNPWTKLAVASTGLSNRYLILLAYCNAAPDPPNPPVPFATSYTDARLSGFSLGSPLTDAERLQYKAIWDTFETAVGRGHP